MPGFPPGNPIQTPTIPIARSSDPNGKITVGYGNLGYIPPDATITYTIYFENQSSATAPAATVVVTDPLDPNLDPSTVQLAQIGFNNVTLSVPGALQSYSTQASVSTSPYPVTVSASLNPSAATLTWTMQSIDPSTGAAPADPLAGFLPPDNSSQQGEGFVTFTVKPKSGLANGTAIYNQASIVFDLNAAISTNKVTNTIDSVYPSSTVSALPATQTTTSFTVSWSGSDPSGSGIASYDVFSATDSGAYSMWIYHTTSTSAAFTGSYGHSYSFYSMATDNVGNRQHTPGPAQTTLLDEVPSITSASSTTFTVSTVGTFTVTAIGFPTVALGEVGALPSGVNFKDNGNGSATLSGTPAAGTIGTYTITITASNGAGTNATQSFSLIVNGIATSVTLTASSNNVVAGTQITLTANVARSSSTTGTPTGTITFMDGSTTLGTGTLSASGSASYITSSLSVGAHTISSSYGGDSSDASSTSPTVAVTITDFSLPASPPSLTVTPGQSASTTLTITPISGFTGTVSFACTVPAAMAEASCSATSVSLTGTSPATSTLTVTTTGAHTVTASIKQLIDSKGMQYPIYASALILLAGRRRRMARRLLMVILMALAFGALVSCGGGGSGSTTKTDPGTPAGSYNLAVVATNGSDSHTLTLPVTVQ